MNIVTRKLIAKEFHVNRWFMAGAIVAGAASAFIASFGRIGFNMGSIAWFTTVIALGVMLSIYGVAHERKENSLQFVLSLPLSSADYVRAKIAGLTLCFGLPWLVAGAAAASLVLFDPDVPDGMLPYTILVSVYLLVNFAVVLCSALHVTSEGATAAVIVLTNMSVSLFLFLLVSLPGIAEHMQGAVPVWHATFWLVLATEILMLIIALTLPLMFAARRRDFL